MAKRKTAMTAEKIQQMSKEGRGQGEGKDYKPWIVVQDVPSQGLASRGKGWKTGRIHHCLSNLEFDFLALAEWDEAVVDIREQYPLIQEDTVQIADAKGFAHPRDPKTKELIVMTTDFLLTVEESGVQKKVARTIKPSKELERRRVLEKLEIERAYWQSRGVDWRIVTEKEQPKEIVSNIKWLHPFYFEQNEFSSSTFESYVKELHVYLERIDVPIIELVSEFDRNLNLDAGTGLGILKHLMARRRIRVDIRKPIKTHLTLRDILENLTFPSEGSGA